MTRISLQEQYENKDVIQQIYILKDEVNGVSGTAEDAKTTADDALSKVSTAYTQSNQAMAQATLAKETADKAQADATQALADAEQAQADADNAVASGSVVVDTVSAKLRLVKVSGESEDSVIPIASETQTGMMNSQTFKGLSDLGSRVTALENKATTVYVTFPSDSPSQGEITSAFTSAAGRPPAAGDYATDISRDLTYGYNGSTWVQAGGSSIPAFTNTNAGLIKGNTAEGTVFAEADGTGSVKGWDELKQSVNINGIAIGQNASSVRALTTRVATLESDAWEELDVTDVPTDFREGDLVVVGVKGVVKGAADRWTASPSMAGLYPGEPAETYLMARLHSTGVVDEPPCLGPIPHYAQNCLAMLTISELYGVDCWNGTNTTFPAFKIRCKAFNGGGFLTVTDSDLSVGEGGRRDWSGLLAFLYRMHPQ